MVICLATVLGSKIAFATSKIFKDPRDYRGSLPPSTLLPAECDILPEFLLSDADLIASSARCKKPGHVMSQCPSDVDTTAWSGYVWQRYGWQAVLSIINISTIKGFGASHLGRASSLAICDLIRIHHGPSDRKPHPILPSSNYLQTSSV